MANNTNYRFDLYSVSYSYGPKNSTKHQVPFEYKVVIIGDKLLVAELKENNHAECKKENTTN